MTVQYTNRRSKTYYLHEGKTKTGTPQYYFSTKKEGKLVGKMPEGYEIYEHPTNARVLLRKKQPKIITDIEKQIIDKYLTKLETPRRYVLDIKGKVITIFESDQDIDNLKELFGDMLNSGVHQKNMGIDLTVDSVVNLAISYCPVMRFALEDEVRRTFIAERYCFKGSIDDWIYIGGPDSLEKLVRKYVIHLGTDFFYDLY
ncbi:MAG: hypothetical protein ABIF87_07130 [Pseudomonadota bacterium]